MAASAHIHKIVMSLKRHDLPVIWGTALFDALELRIQQFQF